MQIKMQKCAKYMQESTNFNGKRNLGVTGYGLWVMGYGLWVTGYGLPVMGYRLRVTGYKSHWDIAEY